MTIQILSVYRRICLIIYSTLYIPVIKLLTLLFKENVNAVTVLQVQTG